MSQISDGGRVHRRHLSKISATGRGTLASRILWVSIFSVLITASVALVVSFLVLTTLSNNQTRTVLADQADTLANVVLLGPDTRLGEELIRDLVRQFENENPSGLNSDNDGRGGRGGRAGQQSQVIVVPVDMSSSPAGPISAADISAVVAGESVSYRTQDLAINYFVEGRPLVPGQGVFLIQRTSVVDSNVKDLLGANAIALVIGLFAASLLALLVARRTAKPMHEAAQVATELASGNRDVSATLNGPVEVADISAALNLLAENLALSEDRQREFLMSISHELRTPLTSIKGYAEALSDGVIEPEETSEVGALLSGETARLERLVSDLLDLARAQAVEFRIDNHKVNLVSVAGAAAEAWRLRCERLGINFEFKNSTEAAEVLGDETRIRQMIDNLVENAVRVSAEGGLIRLSIQAHAAGFAISVEDNGPGLAPDDYETAFEPAVLHNKYRGKRDVGTGLGLALVGKLAERMNATVSAKSSELGGAAFEIVFPETSAK